MGANRDLDPSRWLGVPSNSSYLHDKAEKLLKYFGRLMAIEVAVDQGKHAWEVEILVSAEHKHDFVAREDGPDPRAAMDQCVHKIEHQLRRYKEKVQHHKGDVSHGGGSPRSSDQSAASRDDVNRSQTRSSPA